jgi:hypothetical protein
VAGKLQVNPHLHSPDGKLQLVTAPANRIGNNQHKANQFKVNHLNQPGNNLRSNNSSNLLKVHRRNRAGKLHKQAAPVNQIGNNLAALERAPAAVLLRFWAKSCNKNNVEAIRLQQAAWLQWEQVQQRLP